MNDVSVICHDAIFFELRDCFIVQQFGGTSSLEMLHDHDLGITYPGRVRS